jgi:hypothetical protein
MAGLAARHSPPRDGRSHSAIAAGALVAKPRAIAGTAPRALPAGTSALDQERYLQAIGGVAAAGEGTGALETGSLRSPACTRRATSPRSSATAARS